MLVLNEGPEKILSDTLIAKNKLFNMKNQLENLLKKKIRLDNELMILKRSIKRKEKHLQIKLKTSINLEAFGPDLEPTEESDNFISRELPELVPHLIHLDQLIREIDELLKELEEQN